MHVRCYSRAKKKTKTTKNKNKTAAAKAESVATGDDAASENGTLKATIAIDVIKFVCNLVSNSSGVRLVELIYEEAIAATTATAATTNSTEHSDLNDLDDNRCNQLPLMCTIIYCTTLYCDASNIFDFVK